jgi:hypothetical protein
MRSFRTFLQNLLAAGALVALWIAVPAPAMAHCGTETDVGSTFILSVPENGCTVAEAPKLCKQWVKECKKRVNTIAKCRLAGFKSGSSFGKKKCKLDSTANPKVCKQVQGEDLKNAKPLLKADKLAGFTTCEGFEPACVSRCD